MIAPQMPTGGLIRQTVFDDESHYRWWIMGYQLWLAERAVHASVLWALLGADRHRQLTERILTGLAQRYLSYPNVDNVLGPTRPFFSTYLESIWLLQLVVALDIVEQVEGPARGFRLGLPPAGTRTPYDRVGDVVPWVAAGIALIAAARWIVRVRRSRPGQVPFEGNPPGGKSVSVVGAQPGDAPRPEPPGEDAPPPEGAAG